MFVLWRSRWLIKKEDYSLYAVLVQSRREGDRIRQVYIKQLGAIREKHIGRTPARVKFWGKVERRLSELNIDPETRQSIVNMIEKKIERL